MTSTQLSAKERDVLSFERDWHLHVGHKQQAIRDRFGFTPTHYYQVLGRALERDDADAFDPLLVRRLRRQRERRTGAQSGGLTEQVVPTGRRRVSK